MAHDADAIVDRRRLRRKLTFWRLLAVAVVIVGLIGAAAFASRQAGLGRLGASIARVSISGLIRGNQQRVEALERLGRSSVKAVIVHIDSPGGTTSGAEQLFDALRRLSAVKPVVVVVDGMAASGGYIAAISADHIVARSTSLVGSIGVLFQYPNFTDVLKTIGLKVEEVKSSPLKAAPSGFEPTSPEARAALEALVKDSYAWFRDMVATRRSLRGDDLERVADGRVFTGRQAIGLKLIDELGDENTAIAWLAKEKGIDAKTRVRDYSLNPSFDQLSFLHLGAGAVLDMLGLQALARRLDEAGLVQAIDRLNLDGMLALWHPPAAD